MDINCIYTAASVNRAPHCLAWAPHNDVIIFGSSNAVTVAKLDAESACLKIEQTLAGHTARVNCVRWLSGNTFASASTDGTVRTWSNSGSGEFNRLACLKGHGGSVTCVDGYQIEKNESYVIASASADSSIKVWNAPKSESVSEALQTIPIHRNGFALDLRVIEGPSETVFLIASTDACKILIFCSGKDEFQFLPSHQLIGHEDWVQCLSVVTFRYQSILAIFSETNLS